MCIKALLNLISGKDKPPVIPPVKPPIMNKWPVAYPPFTTTMDFASGARVDYDLRYREHGCNAAGHPTSVTGAKDPDGDTLEYCVTCVWSVFDAGRNKINGLWLEFPKDDRGEQLALVTLFIGWTKDAVPYTFHPKCAPGGETARGCQPSLQPTPFTYEVRDHKGGMASHTIVIGY